MKTLFRSILNDFHTGTNKHFCFANGNLLLSRFPHEWIIKLVLSNYTPCETLDSGIIIFFRSKFINLAVESVRRKL